MATIDLAIKQMKTMRNESKNSRVTAIGLSAPEQSAMTAQQRADEIAMQAVVDSSKSSLRSPSDQRIAVCLEELTTLLSNELNASELAIHAATATYRASFYLHSLRAYENSIAEFLTEIDAVPTRGRGKAKIIQDALAKLGNHGHPLVSILVNGAQATVPTLKASSSGKKGKVAINEIKAFAIGLFEAGDGTWASTMSARNKLWPKVQAEATRRHNSLSEETGPETLYGWLREHVKRMASTSKRTP